MIKVFAFLADGLEEVECLAVVDVLRRSGIEVTLVSVTDSREITGSHNIRLRADALFTEVSADEADVLFLPGGMPGTKTLQAHEEYYLTYKGKARFQWISLANEKCPWRTRTASVRGHFAAPGERRARLLSPG